MEIRCDQIKKLSKKALSDAHLQKALKNVEARLAADRNAAFAALENAEELRDKAHKIKQNTLDRLDEHLVLLEERLPNWEERSIGRVRPRGPERLSKSWPWIEG